ncbi:BlaI/MecI/CopY family transcriptional regulator [Gemmatimonas sp.]|uniref:BlaI/MecI/CopY family transcriptional regulator n=1 Tax=Gemmatimonas sp. TaxID=1962908 RepID=UPI00286DE184|nr:BlaI/MecI/CopY family transcriptional regulator [Gemmatimonas sp.]
MNDSTLGDRELDVMSSLWELGSGTVTEVRDHLGDPLAYTTVLTVLRNLEAKYFVRHEEEGRAHRYFPLVERQTAQRNALSRLMANLFAGSPSALIAQLVDEHGVSADELQQLARKLKARPEGDA